MGSKVYRREIDILAENTFEKYFLYMNKLIMKLNREFQKSCFYSSLGLFEKVLPQKIEVIDLRKIDEYDPIRSSWKRKVLMCLVPLALESVISQDEILNYLFRIDTLFYDFKEKGVGRIIENKEVFEQIVEQIKKFRFYDERKEELEDRELRKLEDEVKKDAKKMDSLEALRKKQQK